MSVLDALMVKVTFPLLPNSTSPVQSAASSISLKRNRQAIQNESLAVVSSRSAPKGSSIKEPSSITSARLGGPKPL
eukprot:3202059-Amphidinium_carterae.1